MKKTLLSIYFLLLTFFGYSQTYNKVYKTSLLHYSDGDWNTIKENYPLRMFVILKESEVMITNEAGTKLMTYGTSEKRTTSDGESWSWDAYDEEGKQCTFMMKRFYTTKDVLYTIAYFSKNVAFQYYTND